MRIISKVERKPPQFHSSGNFQTVVNNEHLNVETMIAPEVWRQSASTELSS